MLKTSLYFGKKWQILQKQISLCFRTSFLTPFSEKEKSGMFPALIIARKAYLGHAGKGRAGCGAPGLF
jgi:hypothetical protein